MDASIIKNETTENQSAKRIGVYVCHCGLNIGQTVDCKDVAEMASGLEGVMISKDIPYACSEPGQKEIVDDIVENGLDKIVMASCSPRLHEPTFRQMMESVGLNPYMLEMANLREQCSWVHMKEPDAATRKAKDLVRMAVSRAQGDRLRCISRNPDMRQYHGGR